MTATAAPAARKPRQMRQLYMNGVGGVRRAANRSQLGDGDAPVDGWAVMKEDGSPVTEEATVPAPTTTTDAPEVPEAVAKAMEGLAPEVREHFEQIAKDAAEAEASAARVTELEAQLAAAPAADTTGDAGGTVDPVAKAMENLDPELRAHFERVERAAAEDRERLAESEKVAKEERNIRIDGEFVTRAAAEFGSIGSAPETFGVVLRSASESMPAEHFAELERVLRSANAVASKSPAFTAVGSSGAAGGGSAWARIEKAAEELQEKDPTLTKEIAIDRVAASQPQLMAEYAQETR